MLTEDLITEAAALPQPSLEAVKEFAENRERLVSLFNTEFGKRPDLARMIGETNQLMMEDNHRNHARFMESMFQFHAPKVLVDTILWVYRTYRSHGFTLAYWPAQLDSWVELYRRELSAETLREIEPFYNWMIIRQPAFAEASDTWLGPDPVHEF
jgi:hypothetical protein